MSQRRGMLVPENGDLPHPGGHLHPGLRLLRREEGQAPASRSRRARARRRGRRVPGAGVRGHHLRHAGRPRGRRRFDLRPDDRAPSGRRRPGRRSRSSSPISRGARRRWTRSSTRGRISSTTTSKRPRGFIPSSTGRRPTTAGPSRSWPRAKKKGAVTKSGLMIGLGEREEDVLRTLSDLRASGLRPPDPRPISQAGAREPSRREILFPDGIRTAEGHRPGLRVRRRRRRAPRPELVRRREAVPLGRREGLRPCATWSSPTSTATWKPSWPC